MEIYYSSPCPVFLTFYLAGLLLILHIEVFMGVWMTECLLRFPGLFSVLCPILIKLSIGMVLIHPPISRSFSFFPKPPIINIIINNIITLFIQ